MEEVWSKLLRYYQNIVQHCVQCFEFVEASLLVCALIVCVPEHDV